MSLSRRRSEAFSAADSEAHGRKRLNTLPLVAAGLKVTIVPLKPHREFCPPVDAPSARQDT